MTKQEELRKKVRFLKWNNNIDYGEIADAIGMSRFSFYNFIGGKKVDLGYKTIWKLEQYINERTS